MLLWGLGNISVLISSTSMRTWDKSYRRPLVLTFSALWKGVRRILGFWIKCFAGKSIQLNRLASDSWLSNKPCLIEKIWSNRNNRKVTKSSLGIHTHAKKQMHRYTQTCMCTHVYIPVHMHTCTWVWPQCMNAYKCVHETIDIRGCQILWNQR